MTDKQIEIVLQQGESSVIEFKKRINKELASEICAFSNSQGGIIMLGVDDKNIVTGLGIDNTTRSKLESSISAINPRPELEIIETRYNDKNMIIIDCKAGKNKPYIISGSIYVRYGANSQKLVTAIEIRDFFQQENILSALDENNKITYKELSIKANISQTGIINNMKKLKELNIIERMGEKRTGFWQINTRI